jgi:hypothetical protein
MPAWQQPKIEFIQSDVFLVGIFDPGASLEGLQGWVNIQGDGIAGWILECVNILARGRDQGQGRVAGRGQCYSL